MPFPTGDNKNYQVRWGEFRKDFKMQFVPVYGGRTEIFTNRTIRLKNFYIISINHTCGFILPENRSDLPHSHDHCEIFIHLRCNLNIFVETNSYNVQDESVRLHNHTELHYGKSSSPQMMEWYQLSVPRGFFEEKDFVRLSGILYAGNPGEKNEQIFFNQELAGRGFFNI